MEVAKTFNVTGLCIPAKHYMVDLGERIRQIRKMVDRGDYFCINRARQYGKTTTLAALAKALDKEYLVQTAKIPVLAELAAEMQETVRARDGRFDLLVLFESFCIRFPLNFQMLYHKARRP